MDNGLILIIIGAVISLTLVGALVGVPLIFIGVYLTHKNITKVDKIEDEIAEKQEELENIEETLAQKEQEHQEKLDQIEKDRLENIEEEIRNKSSELGLDIKEKERQIQNLDAEYQQKTEKKEAEMQSQLENLEANIVKKEFETNQLEEKLNQLKEEIITANDDIEMQEYGLYEPKYDFITSTEYKEKLDAIRKQQKELIKTDKAAQGNPNMTLDGSLKKGQAMIKDNVKQILLTFNIECENVISKVKHSNLDNSKKRIMKSYEKLNKMNKRLGIYIKNEYLQLKFEELDIAYKYAVKKEEEKEALREAREREREEKKLKKELEKEKKKFEKQNTKINSEIEEVKAQMAQAAEEEKAKLEAEIAKLQEALNKNNEEVQKINEWKEKPGAGYVYIISNIGSFGENVFKIGVTRRENPEDRIRELSSASVPFRYDAHVFIFSKDAYDLESRLHKRFDKKRVNRVNMRKEFFRITIDDVKQIVEENKGAVHSFVEHPDAEEYYDTLKIEKRESKTVT